MRSRKSGARVLRRWLKDGFTAVKFDPLLDVMSVKDPQETPLDRLDNAEAVVRAVREAVGGSCDILIGTHGPGPQLPLLCGLRNGWSNTILCGLKSQCRQKTSMRWPRVAQHTSIPVATGERLAGRFEFRQLLEAQAAAILQPALGRVGGIFEAKKIASMAEAYYAQIAPHLYCGPIEEAANIQLDVCSPNFLIQEKYRSIRRLPCRLAHQTPQVGKTATLFRPPNPVWGWNLMKKSHAPTLTDLSNLQPSWSHYGLRFPEYPTEKPVSWATNSPTGPIPNPIQQHSCFTAVNPGPGPRRSR